ncbi:glycogen-binding subunit 76A-like [Saccoglossus kowalevskii]|uniref:Glycogen-binding subunit 76A-like n=1 Tax=Saccoglossus kowalevskii TaxID=10224 RepID=A0ABM0ME22_SACKO|nr:PREDICTED: glycogen-binding subunit 76A-like [Saccoglossus kowalevskii]
MKKNPNVTDVCADWHCLDGSELEASPRTSENNQDETPVLSRRPSGSCLKSPGKTPPGTPTEKKQVRFADEADEADDLAESVRVAFDDLGEASSPTCPVSSNNTCLRHNNMDTPLQDEYRYLAACFPQPGALAGFLQRVNDQKVCLESLVVAEDMTILGTIRVANTAYVKHVNVRFTTDNWKKYYDIPTNYVQNSCDGATDQFSFSLSLPNNFTVGTRLEFAVFYRLNGQEYWDNNNQSNYIVACYAKTACPNDYRDRWWHHFV